MRNRELTFDLAGALTLTIGQIVLVYGVVEAGLKGWSTFDALGPIVLGIALLGVFGLIEVRFASNPLIPFKALTKTLQAANNIVLLFSAALFPMWVLSSLYLQQVLGLSPLHTGLIFLPMTLVLMLVAQRAGKLVNHFGVRPVLGAGLVMLTAGLLLLQLNRLQRQRHRLRADPRPARGGRDRDVDRALDDRRDDRCEGGPGGACLGPRQHLAPGRRRPRPGGADHAGHAAHDAPDRGRRAGAGSADAGLCAGVPDRRRLRRRGGALDVPLAARAGRGAGQGRAALRARDRSRARPCSSG